MKKFYITLGVLALLLNGCGKSTNSSKPQTAENEQNQSVMLNENDENLSTNTTPIKTEEEQPVESNETIDVMEHNESETVEEQTLDTHETVDIVENNQSETVQTHSSNENNTTTDRTSSRSRLISEPYFSEQWYLEENRTFYEKNSIDANASIHFGKSYRYTGKGVKIAIIDDGLDVTHPELEGSIVATYDISRKSSVVSHNSIDGYHGTAVTGIIGANDNGIGIKGIASESKIMFLKHKEGMSDSQTIELFNKAEEFGADIINCSWGTYDVSQAVKEVIQNLAKNGRNGKGTIIVFATGNDGQEMGNDESAIPEVIAVGSTDKDNLRAWYS